MASKTTSNPLAMRRAEEKAELAHLQQLMSGIKKAFPKMSDTEQHEVLRQIRERVSA